MARTISRSWLAGGASAPNDPLDGTQFSIEEMRAIVEEARAAKTYVMAHAYSPEAIQRAVQCGVRSIEHGNLIDENTARMMVDHDACRVLTLSTYAAITRRGKALGWSDAMLHKTAIVTDQGLHALKIAQDAGAKIGLGTDLLGDMMVDQLEELTLRERVMSPAQILRSATAVNAGIMGLAGQVGEIVPSCAQQLRRFCTPRWFYDRPVFLIYITAELSRRSDHLKDASNLHLTRPFIAI
ncbi:amidohydrolase family protein [Paraburkholderia sp. A1RO-5L]|uniref:amidohydrolase family protein n=1 Tax=unclassified Paraburkholderia TaxID=2615204 RepID=UPI003B7BA12B